MRKVEFSEKDKRGFEKAFSHCNKWSLEHQAEIGLAEMALGAALVAFGVQVGEINFGTDLVATKFSDGGTIGGGVGAGIGAIGATLLGSIGVAGAFTFGIPAIVLAGGGILILGAAGYGLGDIAQKLLAPGSGFSDLIAGGSLLAVGVALMIDGARRVVKDERVLRVASKFKDGVIELVPVVVKIVARTVDELHRIIIELSKNETASIAAGTATAAAATAGGAALGSAAAIASVTVLGSQGLGAAALALGAVSAPVWPVIAGGAAGLAVGVAAWKGIQYLGNKS